jgi:hypothetical protein
MRVHCPRNAPVRDYHWVDYHSGQDHHISTRRWAEISSLGEVEVVAHATGVAERLVSLDLNRARQLGAVDNFWKVRQDMLAKSVAEVRFLPAAEHDASRSMHSILQGLPLIAVLIDWKEPQLCAVVAWLSVSVSVRHLLSLVQLGMHLDGIGS